LSKAQAIKVQSFVKTSIPLVLFLCEAEAFYITIISDQESDPCSSIYHKLTALFMVYSFQISGVGLYIKAQAFEFQSFVKTKHLIVESHVFYVKFKCSIGALKACNLGNMSI
jgi:hypothetical protein